MSRVNVRKNHKADGSVAHGSADAHNPIKIGGVANDGTPANADSGDRVDAHFSTSGERYVIISGDGSALADGISNPAGVALQDATAVHPLAAVVYLLGSDGNPDRVRSAGDSGPGLGAQNVAIIGGDITLRSSAIAGETSGTSTAVDNLG